MNEFSAVTVQGREINMIIGARDFANMTYSAVV
jgi:hypothetical protein